MSLTKQRKKYGFPAILSFLVPGFGQVVKGEIRKGIVIFVAYTITVNSWWLFHISTIIELAIAAVIFWPQVYDAYDTEPCKRNNKTKNWDKNGKLQKPILLMIAIIILGVLLTLSYLGGQAYTKDIQKKALIKELDQKRIDVDAEYDICVKSASNEKYIEQWNYWCKVLNLKASCNLPTYYSNLVDEVKKINEKGCNDIRKIWYDYINTERNSL